MSWFVGWLSTTCRLNPFQCLLCWKARGNKEKERRDRKKEKKRTAHRKGHESTNWETEGGRLWDKSFLKHHKGLDVSCHLTCGKFGNDNSPQVEREGTNTRKGVRWAAGEDWNTFLCKKSGESSWEGGIVCVYVCVFIRATPDLWICLRLCHPEQQLSWEPGCLRNRHISITRPLFFVILVNVIQYHPRPHAHERFTFVTILIVCSFLSSLVSPIMLFSSSSFSLFKSNFSGISLLT